MILDTTILVASERGDWDLDEVIRDDDDVAIAALTAAELLVGVELADSRRRQRRSKFVEAVSTFQIEGYDLRVARAHAQLLAHVRKTGRPRGAHDLIIAATAANSARIVVTADPDGFDDLPNVRVRTP